MTPDASRSSEQIRAEIERAFGFFPPFFAPALPTPPVLESLWQQTRLASLQNPLPTLFRERLHASLSRFCVVPYCVVCHAAALRPLGMTARQIRTLLETPPPEEVDVDRHLAALGEQPVLLTGFPDPDSAREQALIACTTALFLGGPQADRCRACLARVLGADLFNSLSVYLAYVKTCHFWAETHPEIDHQADRRVRDNLGPLLAEEPALGDFLRDYQERMGARRLSREDRRAADETLRAAQARTSRILESITDAFFALDTEWRFTYINSQAEAVWGRPRAELLGKDVWDEFPQAIGSTFDRQFRRARMEGVAVPFEEFYPPLDAWLDVRTYPSPDGLSVFFQNVNVRKRAENERERLLAEQRERAEREALLNRIGQALRGSSDPNAVQETGVSLLGEALGADRCYFAVYDLERGAVTVAHDWRRAGLPSIQGTHPFTNTVEMFHELYHDSLTSVIEDAHTAPVSAQTRANMASLGLRSRISVALVEDGGLMATLTAAMSDAPRAWSAGETATVEAVATQLRAAVEMARIIQREHAIATQLQQALQPALPGTVPGLALSSYYRPALAQSEGVGGDFFDVFAVEKGCTALVVGDLSGKGLAAAAQVATVRNMLRAFLYSQPTVGEAVTLLNHVLAENNLLAGFSTLFVGAYESATGNLKYVNCGQEPALVRRSGTGAVETLGPTGPILGAIDGAQYADADTTLGPGDVLAIFTDGLTEAGASRAAMLGMEGVAALLAEATTEDETAQDAAKAAESLARRLIAGVDAYAQAGARDDTCLLVGVRDGH